MALLLLSELGTIGLLSALWLVGFLLIWNLMRVRIVELEQKIHALVIRSETARSVPETARIIPEDKTGPRLDELARDVASTKDSLERVAAVQERLHDDTAYLLERVERLATALEQSRAGELSDRIHDRLGSRGFSDVRILGELTDVPVDAPLKVMVEARKSGISYKGFVVVADGNIVDEKMTSAHELFP